MKKLDEIEVSAKRLENMKQATIVNYLSDIDLDNDLDLYDTMIHLFVDGTLDYAFYSPIFDKMNADDRKKLFKMVRKYISLCFFDGNPNYWTDSVEGISLLDSDFICMKILDNYHYLLELAKDGGEELLKQIKEFQLTDLFSNSVMIDYLRNTFDDDELLKKRLLDVCLEDESYQGLTSQQKAILFRYPVGVLYTVDDKNQKKLLTSDYLKNEIIKRISSSQDLTSMSLKDVVSILGNSNFEEIVSDIYLDSMVESISLLDNQKKKIL